MAKLVYWDIINGDDGNDGLTIGAPVRTMGAAQTAAANGDRVIIAPGVYPVSVLGGGAKFQFSKNLMWTPQQKGTVIFDFENTLPVTGHLESLSNVQMRGIQFRNPGVGRWVIFRSLGTLHMIDCVFYQRDGAANTGMGVSGDRTFTFIENCTFFNLLTGIGNGSFFNSYFKDVTNIWTVTVTSDFNAYSGNVEANGLDIDDPNTDPGFIDSAAEDFRLDPTDTVAIAKFRTLGQFGSSIGAVGAPGPWWDARFAQSRWMVPDPTPGSGMHGVWINDAAYVDPVGGAPATGEIVEDTGDFEPIVDLASTPAALSGRALGPVFDWGTSQVELNNFSLARFDDLPAGAVIDTDLALPQKMEYRQSSSSFAATDPPSTDLVWVEFEFEDQLDLTLRYQQFAITFQIDHTGA